MTATNDDIVKAINELNDTLKYVYGVPEKSAESIKSELLSRVK